MTLDFNLSPDDVVTVHIAQIGTLRNRVISASHQNFGWLTSDPTRSVQLQGL